MMLFQYPPPASLLHHVIVILLNVSWSQSICKYINTSLDYPAPPRVFFNESLTTHGQKYRQLIQTYILQLHISGDTDKTKHTHGQTYRQLDIDGNTDTNQTYTWIDIQIVRHRRTNRCKPDIHMYSQIQTYIKIQIRHTNGQTYRQLDINGHTDTNDIYTWIDNRHTDSQI